MFRVWGKLMKDNRPVKDHVAVIDRPDLNRTKRVYMALEEICNEFQLAVPIWLNLNKKDFVMFSRTRFTQDSFIEEVDFDYLDFWVIEEEY